MDCGAFAHGRAGLREPAALPPAQGNMTISSTSAWLPGWGTSSGSQSSQRNCWRMACSGAVATDPCAMNSSMPRFGLAKINGIWPATERRNAGGTHGGAQLGAPELLLWERQQTLGRVRRKVNYDIGQPGNALRLRQPRSGGDCQCSGQGQAAPESAELTQTKRLRGEAQRFVNSWIKDTRNGWKCTGAKN